MTLLSVRVCVLLCVAAAAQGYCPVGAIAAWGCRDGKGGEGTACGAGGVEFKVWQITCGHGFRDFRGEISSQRLWATSDNRTGK